MLRDTPILFDPVDADAYVARPALERRLQAAARAAHGVLVVGDGGSGKTTMLNWLAHRLQAEEQFVARVDAALASSTMELLDFVRMGVAEALSGLSKDRSLLTGPSVADESVGEGLQLQAAIRRLRVDQGATILLDNLTDHEIIRTLFGRMRDLTWATGHRWVVAARRQDRRVFLSPPADAFFVERIELEPLDDNELLGFATRGGSSDDLTQLEHRLPRDIVQHVLRPRVSEPQLAGEVNVDDTARQVLREIRALDRPVAADDEELLGRVALSTFTLKRHLRSLADRGLLDEESERSGRPGRPRLLYSPHHGGVADAG